MMFRVINFNCLAQLLIVNCNIVSSTLKVNPTLFVILCDYRFTIIANMVTYQVIFHLDFKHL